jgi:multidrug efflux pump subunit AcrB
LTKVDAAPLFGFTRLQQQFFPQSSRPELMVDVKPPEGASFVATSRMVKQIESYLLQKMQEPDEIKYFTAYTRAMIRVLRLDFGPPVGYLVPFRVTEPKRCSVSLRCWGPMAIAIMGGLSVATFSTLLNLPCLYVILFRVRSPESNQGAVSETS